MLSHPLVCRIAMSALLMLSLLLSCYSAKAAELSKELPNIGLITGSASGTYIQIGKDIAGLANKSGLDVRVYESKGSLENIAAVFEKEHVQLGLVQSDVLGYLQESQNRKLERVAQQIAMMFPHV